MCELTLNKTTGMYELTTTVQATISVDPECFVQALFSYQRQNGIDPTNQEEWGRAIHATARYGQWKDHPHATIRLGEEVRQQLNSAIKSKPEPKQETRRWRLNEEEKANLRERAKGLPPSEWEEKLLTKTPESVTGQARQWYSNWRTYERKVLEELREEMKGNPLERMEAVRELIGANGIK